MKVVLISDNGKRHSKIIINIWLHLALPVLLLVAVLIFVSQTPYLSQFFQASFSQAQFSDSDRKVYNNFAQVLKKLSILDAEVQRLNTLSTHIASKNKLDITKFDLANIPAQGGSVANTYFGTSIVRSNDIKKSINTIERDIDKQKLKLKNLVVSLEIREVEEFLENISTATQALEKNRKERGRRITYDFSTPMKKGYISSPFGDRRDPINGSLRHHGGLDIAAKKGSNIYAIANGFVSFAGKRGAYGKLLEINHSASLKSRYAHLDKYLVKKGQLVKKGDLIGKVGATGRVTGPHLHLEIRENDKITDPKLYLNQVLKNL